MTNTVCILYGLGEGERVGLRFQKALRLKGYQIVRDPARADIIITHSGGCLLLPKNIKARQILHIGPYYWPGKSWAACAAQKLRDDIRSHHTVGDLRFWLHKSFWNFIYIWQIPKNIQMFVSIGKDDRWQHGDITTVARPRFDAFCTPDPNALPFKKPPAFVTTPGYHDDCWRDPEPYITLLKS